MNKTKLLAALIWLCSVAAMAQLKAFQLDDLLPGGKTYSQMVPQSLSVAWWGNRLMERTDNAVNITDNRNRRTEAFALSDINAALQAAGLSQLRTLKTLTFPYADQTQTLINTSRSISLYDWNSKTIAWKVSVPEGATLKDFSTASRALAYNKNNNLFVQTSDGNTLQISTDGSQGLVYGQSVHRNEFGINKGTFWSPDGAKLCFYRMDQTMVTDYPLVDISTRIATEVPIKYPMAGETSHRVTVGVFNIHTQQTVWLNLGDNLDQYYAGISWSPDSKKIYLYNLNRDQNHLKLWQFDAATGAKEATLYEETSDKYVEPQHGITFLPWDSDKFIYWSDKDGLPQLYLYSLQKHNTVRKITDNRLSVVVSLLGFNAKTRSVLVTAKGCSPIQHNLYSVSVEKERFALLDNGQGVHSAQPSADGSQLVDTWNSPEVPRKVDLLTIGKPAVNLFTSPNPWQGYNVPAIENGSIKAADGTTDLYYRLVKPTNFDPQKKYPTIVYVYGGPHTHLVSASWGYQYRGWEIYMAQLGYVVFVLDNRGSDERGTAFENVTFRHLGREEMKDQIKGVDYLKSLPFVDATRIGVHGWSFGGFMTTNLMLTYPDVFKCGVAGGPVIDWHYYEVMYGERYMDTPQANPEGYKENNLNLRAGNLKGRLLIVFGYNDPVCVPQHSLSFIRACETAGTHPDLFTYPGQEHNMVGADRIHLHQHITRYFEDHLK